MTADERATCVGPVLEAGEAAAGVLAAIRELNPTVLVEDHGSYVRVLVPRRCVLTRAALERALGRSVALPGDLESLMPSFQGAFHVSYDEAIWTDGSTR